MHTNNPLSTRSLDQLEIDLITRSARMNAEEYLFLCDLREFDLRQGWKAYHFNHCSEWLNWKCQLSLGCAREKVRVAHCLFDLPEISKAFSEGLISYSKARAMSRIAGPDNEHPLLDYALSRTALQVERHCKALRNAQRNLSTPDANRAFQARYLCRSTRQDGTMTINMEVPQEMGELVMKAIEVAMGGGEPSALQNDNDPDSEPPSFFARQADAMADIARSYLRGGPDKTANTADNYTVMVHVDATARAACSR